MSLFDKHIIHKPENFTDASGVGLIPDYSGADVKSCGIRFPGLPSVFERIYGTRSNELSPSDQIIGISIEGRVRRGLKTDSTFALNGAPSLFSARAPNEGGY